MIRPHRLCNKCRNDILSVFRTGIYAEPSLIRPNRETHLRLRTRPNLTTSSSKRGVQNRCFHAGNIVRSEPNESSLVKEPEEPEEAIVTAAAFIEGVDDEALEHHALQAREGLTRDAIGEARRQSLDTKEIVRFARQRFGDILPDGVLEDEEYRLYVRLYGEPDEIIEEEQEVGIDGEDEAAGESTELSRPNAQAVEEFSPIPAKDMALALGGQIYESQAGSLALVEDPEEPYYREHPLTTLGKFAPFPSTVSLPQQAFIESMTDGLARFSNKHLKEISISKFGGPDLPDSALTPLSVRTRAQVPIPLTASQNGMGEIEANAFVAAVMPPTYASALATLTETRKRLGASWLRDLITRSGGPRVLDVGGAGAGLLAWNEIVQAQWTSMHFTEGDTAPAPPQTKGVVLVGADTLRARAAALLQNTTFVPRLPDYVHVREGPTLDDSREYVQRKQFDVIISSHSLFSLEEEFLRKQHIQNLWQMLSDKGGVLIIVEKGVPRGFEAVAAAREQLLERYISADASEAEEPDSQDSADTAVPTQKGPGMIIAPCTNHEGCPMYPRRGLSRNRKDFCHFSQRLTRPPFLQRLLDGGHHNYSDVEFSYISVMKGVDLRDRTNFTWADLQDPVTASASSNEDSIKTSPLDRRNASQKGFEVPVSRETPSGSDAHKDQSATIASQPLNVVSSRIILPPIKRTGHVNIDLCTPAGTIERWVVPRSFSKQAFRDARKSQWGDLWSLGAKTATERKLQLGRPALETKEEKKTRLRKERQQDSIDEAAERKQEALLDQQTLEREDARSSRAGLGKPKTDHSLEATHQDAALFDAVDGTEDPDDFEDLDGLPDDDLLDGIPSDLQVEADFDAQLNSQLEEQHHNPPTPSMRKGIPNKKIRALEQRLQSTPRRSANAPETGQKTFSPLFTRPGKSPATPDTAQARLLANLQEAKSDPALAATLKEWEEEFEKTKKDGERVKSRDGRRRVRMSGGIGRGVRR